MIWIILLVNALFIVCLGVHYKMILNNLDTRTRLLETREDDLIYHMDEYNKFVESFDGFYKNKIYQAAMGFMQLKEYQNELLDVLDPVLDKDMILYINRTNFLLDDILKELSFLSKHTVKNKKRVESVIKETYFDETKFSKN